MDNVPNFEELPAYVDRPYGAELITKFYFPISPRTLERWPLETRRVNGRVVVSTRALLAEADQRFNAAPVIKSGARAAERGA